MVRDLGYACLAAALIVASCGQGRPQSRPMQVVAVLPNSARDRSELGTRADPVPLYLTSNVTVSFSEDLDPLSVTTDTVRIVKVTETGPQTVKMARRRIGTRSVTLEPDWPVSADLDDGSFEPGQLYKLEVAGFPLTNTVASKTGLPVGGQFVRYYRAVDRSESDPGPLLPVGLPADPFELTVRSLRMASDMRTVLLHFSLPVDPRTVSPRSFALMHTDTIPIESTRVLSVRRPIYRPAGTPGGAQEMRWSHPSSTIEIRLAEGFPLRPGARFGVVLRPPGAEEYWIRDYRGRYLNPKQEIVTGTISHGAKVELVRLFVDGNDLTTAGATHPLQFERVGQNLNFEGRDGRLQVLARRDVGNGELGVFHPQRSMILSPGVPFGTRRFRKSGPRQFEFSDIYIPAGVTVTLKASGPVELLSTGRIRIDGELRLSTVYAAAKGEFESQTGYLQRVLRSEFGCRLVAAADILVRGSICHNLPDEDGHRPALVLWARSISGHGAIPPRTIRACEPWRVAGGAVQTGFQMVEAMPHGYVPGSRTVAQAWTPWVRLPADFSGRTISARYDGMRGDSMEVFLQVASPDPIDPSQPYLGPAGFPEPQELPLKRPMEVSGRVHVRFLLRAKVIGGRMPLPSVRALVVLGG